MLGQLRSGCWQATPIGQGYTIGLFAAELSTDQRLRGLLPAGLRAGLFDGRFDEQAAKVLIRVSHTNAADTDLMRIAMKVDLGQGQSANLVRATHCSQSREREQRARERVCAWEGGGGSVEGGY